jgi:hypothetical protein
MKTMFLALAGCVLALVPIGCGGGSEHAVCGDQVCDSSEDAASCAEDCGCGNGILNAGEDCDATDLGTATCNSVAHRGGTLACNADCTFDVVGCDQFVCGDGVVDPGEECDGSDLGGATCASTGFSAGALVCGADCTLDVSACCNDFCDAANTSVCDEDTVRTCVMEPTGCLGLELTDCAADDDICVDDGGVATCQCVDRCSAPGIGRCDGLLAETCAVQADGCMDWSTNVDCGTTTGACAVGPQGSTCVPMATGEDCTDPYPITAGDNVIAWTASNADYLTASSCQSTLLTGPDIVLAYTSTLDGIVTYSLDKPASARQVVVVSGAACGTLSTADELSCVSEPTQPVITDTFAVTAGATYYFYVRDTTTGTALLLNPLALHLETTSCASFTNPTSNLVPANGSTLETSQPVLSFELAHPVAPTTGVITLAGDLGTSISFDLSTAPSQVTISNDGRTISIDPLIAFQPGETITVSWSGLVDQYCGAAIPSPTWTFHIATPSCAPGTNGMVGTTVTRIPTGISVFSENYVAADDQPNGYVYLGGSSNLYRVPKAGGAAENVVTAAGISTTPLGEAMTIVGSRVFTLDTTTSTTTPFLTRLTTSGGVTWNPLGYAMWGTTPGATAYSLAPYQGRIYIATNESTNGAATEIWSVNASTIVLPDTPVLEGSFTAEQGCDGIAVDDHYFYLTCDDGNDHLIRVDRTTFQTEVITSSIKLSATKNELYAHDFDGDGTADALYIKTDDETVRYVCSPAGSAPFWQDILATFGSTTTTLDYGLGFDPVANTLWAEDDDNVDLISIH